ncbi:MAG TPA: bifunctional oligoribonuclease/PAP phosphatase NrnA [Thermoanaerobaculia bacterium]|nr:bifunctional oligoribonuclease/PAP phosphatase NrnA [Thermoanaerobaculia bacterium]
MTPRDPALDSDYEEVAKLLAAGRRFLLTGHRNPDGDALGSALGLALALEAAGKEARVVMRDTWSSAYSKLPGIGRVAVADALPADWPSRWDAALAMECPQADRAGWPNLLLGKVINVDHHAGNTRYGALNLVDLPAAATGEIVADLLDLLGWPLTADIATNLWVSLVTDTGSFRYSNTTPKALALGARLVAEGAQPGPVNEFLFEAAPLSSLKLEALVLGTLELHAGGAVATVELPRRFFDESGAKEADTEGLVNRARGIEGVRAAALIREGDPGEIRCSLRSKGEVDVRSVAALHSGGGHRNASGCRMAGTLASAKALLVPEISAAVAAIPEAV